MNKQNIQNAFIIELFNTPEKQIIDKMNDYIFETIRTPQIQETFKYFFEEPQTEEQLQNIKLLMIVYFGFYSTDMTSNYCLIDMKKFLL
jgi:hypothetical protein